MHAYLTFNECVIIILASYMHLLVLHQQFRVANRWCDLYSRWYTYIYVAMLGAYITASYIQRAIMTRWSVLVIEAQHCSKSRNLASYNFVVKVATFVYLRHWSIAKAYSYALLCAWSLVTQLNIYFPVANVSVAKLITQLYSNGFMIFSCSYVRSQLAVLWLVFR